MLLPWLTNKFSGTVYVRIYKNRLNLRHIDSQNDIELQATTPFTTARLLVGDFVIAEKLFIDGIKKLYRRQFIHPRPMIVMHPIDMVEGGLSPVETRVLRELAYGAGGYKVGVIVGHERSDSELRTLVTKL